MAKHRKGGKRRRRGVGSIVTVRPAGFAGMGRLRGLGGNAALATCLPTALGLGAAAVTIIGIRYFADPSRSATEQQLLKFAPLVGLGAGVLTGFALKQMGGQAAFMGAAAGAAGAAALTFASDWVTSQRPHVALAGLGAIVPEQLSGIRGALGSGVGAVVLEPSGMNSIGYQGGEQINLGGINASAFGSPNFTP